MKYDAFISYRHSEIDRFVAENLHKKLEAFRLPGSIVKQRPKDCKKRIERVFRDRDELPLATNLADPITEALANSEFLIVICSPRLPESLWCKKEIETFIDMHGREHVLAVLAEGEPEESFPEELLYRKREIICEDGTTKIVKEAVEPLAADVRGNTKKEILKKMNEELLRLGAAMFGCAYDDLKQRHKEQKMKKMLTASLAASAFFLMFGAISTTMAIRIRSQKQQIQLQSEEIQAQKDEIEVQYQQALYNQSLSLAEKSLDLLKEGDRTEAIRAALEALGTTEDGTPMPVTADAQYALAMSSYLYQDGENYEPMFLLKHNANISLMQVSPNGQRMFTVDNYGNVCVWQIADNKLIAQFADTDLSFATEKKCFFLDDNRILYDSENGFSIYDIDSQQVVYTYDAGGYFTGGKADACKRWFAIAVDDINQETLLVYDMENYELIFTYLLPEGKKVGNAMTFDLDNNRMGFAIEPDYYSMDKTSDIMVMDLITGEVVRAVSTDYSDVCKMTIADGILYAGARQSNYDAYDEGDIDINIPYKSILYAVDIDNMSKKWEYRYDYGMIHDFQINTEEYSRHIMVSFYSEAHIINMDTGLREHEFAYGDEIVTTLYYTNSDRFAVITREGEYHFIDATSGNDIVFIGYFQTNSDNLKQVLLTEKGFVTLPYSDSDVTYYEFAEGTEFEVLCELDKKVSMVCVNEAKERAVAVSGYYDEGTTVSLVDLKTGKVLEEFTEESISIYVDVIGDELFYILTNEMLKIYSVRDGSLQAGYELPQTIYPDFVSVGLDKESVIIRKGCSYWRFNISDGSYELYEIDNADNRIVVSNVNNDFSMYAIADKNENAISVYKMGEEDVYCQIDAATSLVNEILFTDDNQHIFVYYADKTLELFDLKSGACMREYASIGSYLHGLYTADGGNSYLLTTGNGGYLLNSDFELIANIPECKALMPQSRKFIGTDDNMLYTCPVYSTEQLIRKAEEILDKLYDAASDVDLFYSKECHEWYAFV